MLRVGLTGGLASGKSTAAHLFADLGVYVINADDIGRSLMQPGQAVYEHLVRHFGPGIVRAHGVLDRKMLADLAFRHGRLQELNTIVHPPVIAAQEEWMSGIFDVDPQAIAMVESALIFEADRAGTAPGLKQRFNSIVLVTAPDEQKIARHVKRLAGEATAAASSSADEARLRLAAQLPDCEKTPMADFVLDNSGQLSRMQDAVGEVYRKLRSAADRS